MFRKLAFGMCIVFAASSLFAANKEQRRLANSGTVMQEVMGVPDNIPQELLEKAECVIVFPSVLKGAFIVGGSYGRGAMVCRTGEHFDGHLVSTSHKPGVARPMDSGRVVRC